MRPIRQSKVIRSFSSFLSMKLARGRGSRSRRTCAVFLSCKLMAFVVVSVKRASEQEKLKDYLVETRTQDPSFGVATV